jgi:hypothetical protein
MEKFGSGINIPDPQHCLSAECWNFFEPRNQDPKFYLMLDPGPLKTNTDPQPWEYVFTLIQGSQREVVYLG